MPRRWRRRRGWRKVEVLIMGEEMMLLVLVI